MSDNGLYVVYDLEPEHTHGIAARADFFLPVRVVAEVFRGKLLAKLEAAINRTKIPPRRDEDPHDLLKRAAAKRWVVYCKPPFADPEQVLASLARYTHRIACSNDRLLSLHAGQVTFRWKDRAPGNAPRVATLEAEAFLRRFLLHVRGITMVDGKVIEEIEGIPREARALASTRETIHSPGAGGLMIRGGFWP